MRLMLFLLSLLLLPSATFVRADVLADTQAKAGAGVGLLQFTTAVEHLGQSLYRYGLAAPSRNNMMMFPIMRMPVPPNPEPEKLDYQAFRKILETLVIDLDSAEASLAKLQDVDFKLPVDLAAVHFDFNANGKTETPETLPFILTAMMGPPDASQSPPNLNVNFDTADIYWLRGYDRFISAFAQFLLAHDFEQAFDSTFHVFFPQAGLAVGDKLMANRSQSAYADGEIGDVIALIHLMNWPVVDATRLSDVRTRLKDMAALSPKSWAAARKETDNDLEWLPNAKQTGGITKATITDEQINAWIIAMNEFGKVLDGNELLPHWRFDKGINVKRFFEESKRFDLVLLITGTDAVNYLEDGPVSTSTRWNDMMRTFQGNFLGYALWFN
jgi:hypothetical protein